MDNVPGRLELFLMPFSGTLATSTDDGYDDSSSDGRRKMRILGRLIVSSFLKICEEYYCRATTKRSYNVVYETL